MASTTAEYLASVDDITTYAQNDDLDSDAIEQALAFATAIIQSATGQHLFYVEDDTAKLHWPNDGRLFLPEHPVLSVASLTFNPDGQPAFPITQGLSVRPSGQVDLGTPWSALSWSGSPWVTVVYTHGWQVIPADLQAVCVGVAMRTLHKPQEQFSEELGQFTEPTSTAGPAQLTTAEREIVNRYRVRQAGW